MQIFSAGRTNERTGPTEGSTRGPRGPKNIFYFNLSAIFCKASSLIKSNAGNKKQTMQKM